MPPKVFRISPSAAILFQELSLESVVYNSDSIALLVSSFVVFAGSGKSIGRDIYNFAIPTSVELSYKKLSNGANIVENGFMKVDS